MKRFSILRLAILASLLGLMLFPVTYLLAADPQFGPPLPQVHHLACWVQLPLRQPASQESLQPAHRHRDAIRHPHLYPGARLRLGHADSDPHL